MKYTALIVLVLAVSSFALAPKKISATQKNQLNEIRKGNTWASVMINLAELHMMSKGPLEELVQALEDTITDLQFKREKADAAFEKRTAEHNAEVSRLEEAIANAEEDIEDLNGILEMLAEQKSQLEEENAALQKANVDLIRGIREASTRRRLEYSEYVQKWRGIQQSLGDVEECITILEEFANGGSVAFAQVKKAKESISKAHKGIAQTHSADAALLDALVQVAVSQEFAEHSAVMQVIQKFNEIKNNLLDASAAMAAEQQVLQQIFVKFVQDSSQERYENLRTISYNNGKLVENAANTRENQNLLATRIQEKADYEQELQDENDSYNDYVDRYNAWCEENDREVEVCGQALELIQGVSFADYIGDRVNSEDGLVSSGMRNAQPHGQGTEVFTFDYQD